MNKDLTYPNFEWTPITSDEVSAATFLMVDGEKHVDYFILRKHNEHQWIALIQDKSTMTQCADVLGRYNDLETAKSRMIREWKNRHEPEPEPVIRWGWVSDSVRAIAKLYVNERLTDYNVVRFHADKHWTARNDLEQIGNNADIKKCLDVAEEAWKEIES